jgi:hypothetical protein
VRRNKGERPWHIERTVIFLGYTVPFFASIRPSPLVCGNKAPYLNAAVEFAFHFKGTETICYHSDPEICFAAFEDNKGLTGPIYYHIRYRIPTDSQGELKKQSG